MIKPQKHKNKHEVNFVSKANIAKLEYVKKNNFSKNKKLYFASKYNYTLLYILLQV